MVWLRISALRGISRGGLRLLSHFRFRFGLRRRRPNLLAPPYERITEFGIQVRALSANRFKEVALALLDGSDSLFALAEVDHLHDIQRPLVPALDWFRGVRISYQPMGGAV